MASQLDLQIGDSTFLRWIGAMLNHVVDLLMPSVLTVTFTTCSSRSPHAMTWTCLDAHAGGINLDCAGQLERRVSMGFSATFNPSDQQRWFNRSRSLVESMNRLDYLLALIHSSQRCSCSISVSGVGSLQILALVSESRCKTALQQKLAVAPGLPPGTHRKPDLISVPVTAWVCTGQVVLNTIILQSLLV